MNTIIAHRAKDHVCLGTFDPARHLHECSGSCVRERGIDELVLKVLDLSVTAKSDDALRDAVGSTLPASAPQAPITEETVREVIAAEAARGSKLRVLNGDEQPLTHADAAPQRTAQVIRWRGITRHDLPVEQILDAAGAAGLRVAVVLGYDANGKEYFASTVADGADVVWLLERCKLQLLTTSVETDPV